MPKGPPLKLPKLKFPKFKFRSKSTSRGSSRSASPTPIKTNPQEYSVTPINSTSQANSPQQLHLMMIEFKLYRGIFRGSFEGLAGVAERIETPQSQPSEFQGQTIQQAENQEEDSCEGKNSQYQECMRRNSENCQLMFEILRTCQNKFSSTF